MTILTRSFTRLALAATATVVLFSSGCVSLQDDPRNSYRAEHWWLGGETPSAAAWPAASLPELPAMPVESIPPRVQNRGLYDRTPNWPPMLID